MHIAKTDDEILSCFDVLKQLRPEMKQETFIETIHHMQKEGYVLAFVSSDDVVGAVAGFYISTNLSVNGKALYVYDLVTAEHLRSNKLGKNLMDELKDHARRAGCDVIHLDSGVQRFSAHRFYMREGFHISSHHFTCKL